MEPRAADRSAYERPAAHPAAGQAYRLARDETGMRGTDRRGPRPDDISGGSDDRSSPAPPHPDRDTMPAFNTMDGYDRGPARGIVLALVPAAAVWAALFALVAKLLK